MPKPLPLTDVLTGETVLVVEIRGGHGAQNRLRALGIRPGVKVSKVSGQAARGPVVVQSGSAQTALGWGLCRKIIVEVSE